LAAIEKKRFPLMILDLSMSDVDGFDLLRPVRGKHPELKILVATGFLHGQLLEVARLLEADATLDKKYDRGVALADGSRPPRKSKITQSAADRPSQARQPNQKQERSEKQTGTQKQRQCPYL
jgi:DNA-binding NarL/FixJ family response regulator